LESVYRSKTPVAQAAHLLAKVLLLTNLNTRMFTQEQLVGIKNVFEESLRPFADRIDKRFDVLEKKVEEGFKKMDEGFEKMDEKIDFVDRNLSEKMLNLEKSLVSRMDDGFSKMDQKIDFVEKKTGEGFREIQEDLAPVCGAIKKVQAENLIIRTKLRVAEKNKPGLFVS
jgi:hypothetical protein